MARQALPQYERRISAGSAPSTQQLQPGNLGAAVERLGSTVAQVSDYIQKEDASAYTANALSAAHVEWATRMQKMQDEAPLGAPGFVDSFSKDFTQYAREQEQAAPNPVAKKFMRERLGALGATLTQHAVAFQAKSGVDARNIKWDGVEQDLGVLAQKDPEQAKISLAESMAVLMESPNAAWAMERATRLKEKTAVAAVQAMVLRTPNAALRGLNRRLGIEPAPMPELQSEPSSPQTVDPVKPSAGGPEWDSINATMARMAVSPERMGILQDELADPRYDAKIKAAISREIEQVKKLGAASIQDASPEVQRVTITGKTSGSYFIDQLTPQQVVALHSQAQTESHRLASEGAFDLEQRKTDLQSMAARGVKPPPTFATPTVGEYSMRYGASGPARWQLDIGNPLMVVDGIQRMQTATAAERANMVAAASPEPRQGFTGELAMRDALASSKAAVEKQIINDPALYVMRNSTRVSAAADAVSALGDDPNIPQAERASRFDAYASAAIAEQNRIGVSTIRDENLGNKVRVPRLLTNEAATRIADRFNDLSKGDGAQVVDQLAKDYGRWWPTVYGQLAQENKLPPAALVIPNMKDAGSKERLARLAAVSDEDLKKGMESGDPKDVDTKILTALEPFWSTLAVQGGGDKTYEVFRSQAARLAYSYRRGGKSVGDAVAQAVDETVGHQYQFEGTYRVPKTEQPDQVVQGVAQLKRHLEDLPLTIPSVAGMKPEDAKKQWLDAIRSNAMFATSTDENGVVMYVQNNGGSTKVTSTVERPGYQRLPDGTWHVGFTWNQLRDEYKTTLGKPSFRVSKP